MFRRPKDKKCYLSLSYFRGFGDLAASQIGKEKQKLALMDAKPSSNHRRKSECQIGRFYLYCPVQSKLRETG